MQRYRPYAPRLRAERLVALGRVVLAAFSLAAIWLDPAEPAKAAGLAYGLLVAYVLYAAGLALWVVRRGHPSGWWGVVDHGFDLVFFSAFIWFTSGPASPFFAYFVFCLVGATLRWQWRGTLWTAVVSLTAYVGVGVSFALVADDPEFELNRFIIRAVYLVVVAVLLGYLGLHEEETRHEIWLLSQIPAPVTTEPARVAEEVLPWVQRVLSAPRVRLLWADREEPGFRVATLDAGTARWIPLSMKGDDLDRFHPPELGPRDSAADVAPSGRVVDAGGSLSWQDSTALSEEVRAELGVRVAVNLAISGEAVSGRLLILDPDRPAAELLPLGVTVASAVASRLDHLHLARRLQEGAASGERVALGRDLHDGVLQSLSGIGLRLASLERLLEVDGEQAREQLAQLRHLVGLEQRELRFLVDELKSAGLGASSTGERATPLAELAALIERVWDVDVDCREAGDVPELMARQVRLLVREALVNAARHAGASRITASIQRQSQRVEVRVADDGRGFGFVGRRTTAELLADRLGPRSLMERVEALRGELWVESGPGGSSVEIWVPATEGAEG